MDLKGPVFSKFLNSPPAAPYLCMCMICPWRVFYHIRIYLLYCSGKITKAIGYAIVVMLKFLRVRDIF